MNASDPDSTPSWIVPDWPAPAGIRALSTLRPGGVSRGPCAGLNLGDHTGDDPRAVAINRARLKRAAGLPADPLWLRQVHRVGAVGAADWQPGVEADACHAAQAGAVCAVLTADCLPVLLCAADGSRVAAVHAGWRGLAAGVIEAAIAAAGTRGQDLLAWLGPAIGPDAFEVGNEVRERFIAEDPEALAMFRRGRPDRWLADLDGLARLRLRAAGVSAIYGGGWCTLGDPGRFYSYRRDGVTGRMATMIWME